MIIKRRKIMSDQKNRDDEQKLVYRKPRNIGQFSIIFTLLEQMLMLPEDARILDVECGLENRFNRTLTLMVEHPSMPEAVEGQKPAHVNVSTTKNHETGKVTVEFVP